MPELKNFILFAVLKSISELTERAVPEVAVTSKSDALRRSVDGLNNKLSDDKAAPATVVVAGVNKTLCEAFVDAEVTFTFNDVVPEPPPAAAATHNKLPEVSDCKIEVPVPG